MEVVRKALDLKYQLDKLRPIDAEKEARIMQKFRLDWNYHSNHLEGNSLSYGETKALLMFGITAQGKPLKDHFEITGHNEGINYALDMIKGNRPLTENFIREIHQLLLKESYQVDAVTPDGLPSKRWIAVGKYKTTPNHVKTKTGEIFYFATPEETPAKMTELLNWYHKKTTEQDANPILIASEFHYRFISIHPFDDGNGRTARIIMNFILLQFGYPPVIIKTEDKTNYFAVLQLADAGNIEPFIEYIAINLNRSLEIMIAGANGEDIEEEDDLDKKMALLKQKVNNSGEKMEFIKSKELILDFYDNSIRKLHIEFIKNCQIFNEFYINNKFSLTISYNRNSSIFNDLDFERVREEIQSGDNSINNIHFAYHFFSFNRENCGEFNYLSSFSIIFNLNRYIVRNPQTIYFEKAYNEQLSDEEIKNIGRIISENHIKFIEQKIAEKESK